MNLIAALVLTAVAGYILIEMAVFWASLKMRREMLVNGEIVPRPSLLWDGKQYVARAPWYPPERTR